MNKALSHRIAALAVAIACLVSCDLCELGRPVRDRERILFNCSPVSVTVRAGSSFVSNSLLTGLVADSSFFVYAWDTGGAPDGFLTSAPGAPDFINGLIVEFADNDSQGGNNSYDAADLTNSMDQYWPQDRTDYAYSFFAYYPYNAVPVGTPDGTDAQFSFTAKTDATGNPAVDDMIDFCVSDIANDQQYGHTTSTYDGTVDLRFRHMLTMVRVKFVKSQDVPANKSVTIVEAKLDDINTTGKLNLSYTPPAEPGVNIAGSTHFEWSHVGDPESYEITINGRNPNYNPETPAVPPVNPVNLGYDQADDDCDVFLMIPQHIWPYGNSHPQKIHFWWKAEGSDTIHECDDLYLAESKATIGSETPSGIDDWAINRMVTYTVVIKTTGMEFGTDSYLDLNVEIAPWPGAEEDINGYYSIIN